MLRLGPTPKPNKGGLSGGLDAAVEAMKKVPWTILQELKGDPEVLKKIDEAEALLRSLRGALS
jgi:ParB family chromosome partitioning protein